jgi:hypothetical protein
MIEGLWKRKFSDRLSFESMQFASSPHKIIRDDRGEINTFAKSGGTATGTSILCELNVRTSGAFLSLGAWPSHLHSASLIFTMIRRPFAKKFGSRQAIPAGSGDRR